VIGVDNDGRRLRAAQLVATHGPNVDALCNACLERMPSLCGAGVTVMTADTQQVRYASDAVSARVEQLQFLLGEGPCHDAYGAASPVLADDLQATGWQQRWPTFAPAAVIAGAHAVFAIPLLVGTSGLGVLDLYRDTAGVMVGQELVDALIFADAVTDLLLAETAANADDEDLARGAGGGMASMLQRATVHQATGMISVQLGVPVEDALVRLRAHAFAAGREVDEVAADVVARRLRFKDRDDDGNR
jgi:hypothetical protein